MLEFAPGSWIHIDGDKITGSVGLEHSPPHAAQCGADAKAKELTAAGYRQHETDWEIHRGARYRERIVDAVISADGKYVWTKLGWGPCP